MDQSGSLNNNGFDLKLQNCLLLSFLVERNMKLAFALVGNNLKLGFGLGAKAVVYVPPGAKAFLTGYLYLYFRCVWGLDTK